MEFQVESLHQRVQTVCGEILRESVDTTQRLFDILHDQPILLRFVLQSEHPKLVVLHRANSFACCHCPSCGRACSDLATQTLHAKFFFASSQHGVVRNSNWSRFCIVLHMFSPSLVWWRGILHGRCQCNSASPLVRCGNPTSTPSVGSSQNIEQLSWPSFVSLGGLGHSPYALFHRESNVCPVG